MTRIQKLAAALTLLALTAAGCSNDATSTTSPTTGFTFSNEFSGTLTQNGAFTAPFAVLTLGTVSATLVSLSPDSTAIVGLGIGIWDGSACQAIPGVWADKASTGTVVTGTVNAPGNLCVRIYDSTGSLAQPETYDISVVHP